MLKVKNDKILTNYDEMGWCLCLSERWYTRSFLCIFSRIISGVNLVISVNQKTIHVDMYYILFLFDL